MRITAFAIIIGVMLTIYSLHAFAQVEEKRGPRSHVIYGDAQRFITLTFYIGHDDRERLQEILETLQSGNVSKAVFFIEPSFLDGNLSIANAVRQNGYTVHPWNDTSRYDENYMPSSFGGIMLSDRDVLGRTDKMADIVSFYSLALHSGNSSVVAFTPSAPGFNSTNGLLEELVENSDMTLVFTETGNPAQAASMDIGSPGNATYTAVGVNTTHNIVLEEGSWDMQRLQEDYPSVVSIIQTQFGAGYLIDTTVIVAEGAQLNIVGENVLIASPMNESDRRIEVRGDASINSSLVTSWDIAENAPDRNAYHQRPFIFVDGGRLDILNSTISQMGFPVAGLSEERSARAAIMLHDSANFTIANSTISFNFDGIYARNSSSFKILGNDVYGNTRSGIDIRADSHDFAVDSNRVHDNGYEGLICTQCSNVTISGNIMEHNREAGIKLFSRTNSTIVGNNIISFNEKFGIYLKDNSTDNVVRGNTITENEEGITLSGSSINNTIVNNAGIGNDTPIVMDPTSQTNVVRANRLDATPPG